MLDDWGTGPLDSATRSDLLEIIDDRVGHKATIYTSQLSINHWHAWIGDGPLLMQFWIAYCSTPIASH